VQDVLGAHRDAVVAIGRLVELADLAHAEGRDTFTFGVLCVRLEAEAAELERDYEVAWGDLGG
jgi:hypothetical protein